MAVQVDLNADLGELPGRAGVVLDEALLGVVTSANVACGGHAGDRDSMRRVADVAASNQVVVGAHVSYPDRANFGRRPMGLAPTELLDHLRRQLDQLDDAAARSASRVRYIKAHGALYNSSVVSDATAAVLVELALERRLPILTQPDSVLAARATACEVEVFAEFFADRAYESDGRLRSRTHADAVIRHEDTVVRRTIRAVSDQVVTSHDGVAVSVQVDSVCVHGDTPGAVSLAGRLRAELERHPVAIRAFLRSPR
jgi:UPF0271 protein